MNFERCCSLLHSELTMHLQLGRAAVLSSWTMLDVDAACEMRAVGVPCASFDLALKEKKRGPLRHTTLGY